MKRWSWRFKSVEELERALARSTVDPGTLDTELEALKQRLYELDQTLSGNRTIGAIGHPQVPTVSGRDPRGVDGRGHVGLRPDRDPPSLVRDRPRRVRGDRARLRQLIEVDLPALEAKMEAAGVPWTPGRPLRSSLSTIDAKEPSPGAHAPGVFLSPLWGSAIFLSPDPGAHTPG